MVSADTEQASKGSSTEKRRETAKINSALPIQIFQIFGGFY